MTPFAAPLAIMHSCQAHLDELMTGLQGPRLPSKGSFRVIKFLLGLARGVGRVSPGLCARLDGPSDGTHHDNLLLLV